MAGKALHISLFIQGEDGRDFHVRGGRFVDGVTMIVVDFAPGVGHTAVMAGKADLRLGHNFCLLIGNQVRSLAVDEKGVNPSIMTDGALFGRVRVPWCLGGMAVGVEQDYSVEKEKEYGSKETVHGKSASIWVQSLLPLFQVEDAETARKHLNNIQALILINREPDRGGKSPHLSAFRITKYGVKAFC